MPWCCDRSQLSHTERCPLAVAVSTQCKQYGACHDLRYPRNRKWVAGYVPKYYVPRY
jgi:hypothetical protein